MHDHPFKSLSAKNQDDPTVSWNWSKNLAILVTQSIKDHSKMTPPRKCQILDPHPPMSPLVTFFIIPPLPMCHQANSENVFLDQRFDTDNFTYFV